MTVLLHLLRCLLPLALSPEAKCFFPLKVFMKTSYCFQVEQCEKLHLFVFFPHGAPNKTPNNKHTDEQKLEGNKAQQNFYSPFKGQVRGHTTDGS